MNKKYIIYLLILLTVCCVNYQNSLNNEFLVDDYNFLSGKYAADYQTFSDYFKVSKSQHFYPVYYFLNIHLFKFLPHIPYPFHVINVLLFYFVCLLLLRLITTLTGNTQLAFLTSILFAFHPINAICVNLIVFNFILLFAVFMQLSIIAYWYYLDKVQYKKFFYSLSLLFFCLSLLTFEGALLYPLYLGLALILLKKYSLRNTIFRCLPFAVLSLAYFVFWVTVAGSQTGLLDKLESLNLNIISYVSTLISLLVWYIGNLFYPNSIVWIKNIHPANTIAWMWVCPAILALCISFIYILRRGKQIALFGCLWFLTGFLILFPASLAHAYLGMVIEPYWFFFSSFGFFIMIAQTLIAMGERVKKPFWYLSIVSLMILFFTFTQRYHLYWRFEKSFCQHWLKHSPMNSIALFRLGKIYTDEENYKLARYFFNKNLLSGDYQRDKTYGNIALLDLSEGQYENALFNVNKALHINPRYAAAYNTLATIKFKQKIFSESEDMYKMAIKLDPLFTTAMENLGYVYVLMNKDKEAIKLFENVQTEKLNTNDKKVILARLASLYLKNGLQQQCFETIENYLKLDSRPESFYQLALTFHSMELKGMAAVILQNCINRYSNYSQAYLFLGRILAHQGKLKDAVDIWRKGWSKTPDDPRFSDYISQAEKQLDINSQD